MQTCDTLCTYSIMLTSLSRSNIFSSFVFFFFPGLCKQIWRWSQSSFSFKFSWSFHQKNGKSFSARSTPPFLNLCFLFWRVWPTLETSETFWNNTGTSASRIILMHKDTYINLHCAHFDPNGNGSKCHIGRRLKSNNKFHTCSEWSLAHIHN